MSWPALRWVAERCTARGADRAILWAIAYHVNKDTGLAKLSMRTIASESGVSLDARVTADPAPGEVWPARDRRAGPRDASIDLPAPPRTGTP